MPEHDRVALLHKIAQDAVPDQIDLWPAVCAQIAARPRRVAGEAAPTPGLSRRRLLAAGAMAVTIAALTAILVTRLSHPEGVSAEAILNRAQATAGNAAPGITSYHLTLNRHGPALGDATIAGEMWYDGADHRRSDQRTRDGQGRVMSAQQVTFNGDQTWIVWTDNGQSRIVHTTGTAWTNSVDVPLDQANLADVLARYSANKGCLTATQRGEAEVAHRRTYVIELRPRSTGCAQAAGVAPGPVTFPSRTAEGEGEDVRQVTVWIDQQSFLPLKSETRNRAGVVTDQTEVTTVEYNVTIAPVTFSYVPPAGASVFTYEGGTGADVKRALFGDPTKVAPPSNKR